MYKIKIKHIILILLFIFLIYNLFNYKEHFSTNNYFEYEFVNLITISVGHIPTLVFHSTEKCPKLYHIFKGLGDYEGQIETIEGMRFRNKLNSRFYNVEAVLLMERPIIEVKKMLIVEENFNDVLKNFFDSSSSGNQFYIEDFINQVELEYLTLITDNYDNLINTKIGNFITTYENMKTKNKNIKRVQSLVSGVVTSDIQQNLLNLETIFNSKIGEVVIDELNKYYDNGQGDQGEKYIDLNKEIIRKYLETQFRTAIKIGGTMTDELKKLTIENLEGDPLNLSEDQFIIYDENKDDNNFNITSFEEMIHKLFYYEGETPIFIYDDLFGVVGAEETNTDFKIKLINEIILELGENYVVKKIDGEIIDETLKNKYINSKKIYKLMDYIYSNSNSNSLLNYEIDNQYNNFMDFLNEYKLGNKILSNIKSQYDIFDAFWKSIITIWLNQIFLLEEKSEVEETSEEEVTTGVDTTGDTTAETVTKNIKVNNDFLNSVKELINNKKKIMKSRLNQNLMIIFI